MVNNGAAMHEAYVGLGSNLGQREKNITAALHGLETTREIEVEKVSGLYETEPVGGPEDQPRYLNAVARVRTSLSPERLLGVCQQIERMLGRVREVEWGPRTIDLDLLCYDQEIRATSELTLPHPLMHERRFVIEPLAEIAPDLVHPALQRTIRQLHESLVLDD